MSPASPRKRRPSDDGRKVRPTRLLKPVLLVAGCALLSPALAQDVSGPARASDGDTLSLTSIPVRLYGIDAPALAQSCNRDGASWACGRAAADRLTSLIAGKSV